MGLAGNSQSGDRRGGGVSNHGSTTAIACDRLGSELPRSHRHRQTLADGGLCGRVATCIPQPFEPPCCCGSGAPVPAAVRPRRGAGALTRHSSVCGGRDVGRRPPLGVAGQPSRKTFFSGACVCHSVAADLGGRDRWGAWLSDVRTGRPSDRPSCGRRDRIGLGRVVADPQHRPARGDGTGAGARPRFGPDDFRPRRPEIRHTVFRASRARRSAGTPGSGGKHLGRPDAGASL